MSWEKGSAAGDSNPAHGLRDPVCFRGIEPPVATILRLPKRGTPSEQKIVISSLSWCRRLTDCA
jgi:hypothetical protein